MTKPKTQSSDSIFRKLIGGMENGQPGGNIPARNEIDSNEENTIEPSTPQEVVEIPNVLVKSQQSNSVDRVDEALKVMNEAIKEEKEDKKKTKAQPKRQKEKEEEQEIILENKKPMQFNLPVDLRYKIKERAFRKDVTGTKIVIDALYEYFNRLEAGESKKNSLKS